MTPFPPLGRFPPGTLPARGLALFLGGFTLANLAGGALRPRFDANVWWLDVRRLPGPSGALLLGCAGLLLCAFAARPRTGPLRRRATAAALFACGAVALENLVRVIAVASAGEVRLFPVPVSLIVIGAVGFLLLHVLRSSGRGPEAGRRRATAAGVALCAAAAAVAFTGLQIVAFGRTDYRRDADAIVVLGARAYADGRPSRSLADRVRTGCELWHAGRAPLLVLSGGPGDGAHHETEVMRATAVAAGVPESAILLDPAGTSTRATARNVASLLRARGADDALAVSHGWHLPRVKLAFERQGLRVATVPAREERRLAKEPWFVAREIVALWAYWLSA